MSEVNAQKIVLAARPKGRLVANDFRLERTAVPLPGPGQLLLKTKYLSIDPYMRGRLDDRKSYRSGQLAGGLKCLGNSHCLAPRRSRLIRRREVFRELPEKSC
jgi:NADPH-dependent curcumin reductase CurA